MPDVTRGRKFTHVPIDIAVVQSGISPFAKLVYVALCTHVNIRADVPEAWPSINSMAQTIGISRTTVLNALKELESPEVGLITRKRRTADAGDYDSNVYIIHDWRNPLVSQPCSQRGSAPYGPPAARGSPPPGLQLVREANNPIPQGSTPETLPVVRQADANNSQWNQAPNSSNELERIRLTRIAIPELAAAGPCTAETRQAWENALTHLQKQVSKANFRTWLQETTMLGIADNTAYIGAPTSFAVDWLANRLQSLIRKTLAAETGRTVQVVFVTLVDP